MSDEEMEMEDENLKNDGEEVEDSRRNISDEEVNFEEMQEINTSHDYKSSQEKYIEESQRLPLNSDSKQSSAQKANYKIQGLPGQHKSLDSKGLGSKNLTRQMYQGDLVKNTTNFMSDNQNDQSPSVYREDVSNLERVVDELNNIIAEKQSNEELLQGEIDLLKQELKLKNDQLEVVKKDLKNEKDRFEKFKNSFFNNSKEPDLYKYITKVETELQLVRKNLEETQKSNKKLNKDLLAERQKQKDYFNEKEEKLEKLKKEYEYLIQALKDEQDNSRHYVKGGGKSKINEKSTGNSVLQQKEIRTLKDEAFSLTEENHWLKFQLKAIGKNINFEDLYNENVGYKHLSQALLYWKNEAKVECNKNLDEISEIREELDLLKDETQKCIEKIFDQAVKTFTLYMKEYFQENGDLKKTIYQLKEDKAENAVAKSHLRAEMRGLQMNKKLK